MSELQLALIGLGGLLVVGVWGFNLWQEKQQRRKASEMLAPAADVLMAGLPPAGMEEEQRTEPLFETAADGLPEPADMAPAITPELPDTLAAMPLPIEWAEWADGQADCLLRIEFIAAVPVAALWAEKVAWTEQPDKPVQWFGQDEKSARWRVLLPQDAGTITQLAVALQLTDRHGPVTPEVLAAFFAGMRRLAQRFAGLIDLPEAAAILTRATTLDAWCADVDMQLTLRVIPGSGASAGLSGEQVEPVLRAGGLHSEGGRFVAMDAAGAERFALIGESAAGDAVAQIDTAVLAGLLFILDVPRVADGPDAFDSMLALAESCARAAGGQVTDAHRHALPAAKLAAIRSRIAELQAQMAAAGMPAGDVRALRLFA